MSPVINCGNIQTKLVHKQRQIKILQIQLHQIRKEMFSQEAENVTLKRDLKTAIHEAVLNGTTFKEETKENK